MRGRGGEGGQERGKGKERMEGRIGWRGGGEEKEREGRKKERGRGKERVERRRGGEGRRGRGGEEKKGEGEGRREERRRGERGGEYCSVWCSCRPSGLWATLLGTVLR